MFSTYANRPELTKAALIKLLIIYFCGVSYLKLLHTDFKDVQRQATRILADLKGLA